MVSAVITTYKRNPDIVMRAVNSVLAQSYKSIEIIVVDDSPSDYEARADVRNAIERYKGERDGMSIRYICHTHNMGACVARNTGMEAAQGEYIAYLDDDDEWLPTKIEKQMKVMDTTNAALVYCRSKSVNEENVITYVDNEKKYRGRVFMELLKKNFIGSTSFPLIKRECLLKIHGFDPLMQAVQDYDVWLRLAEEYEMDYVDEPLVIYHEHDDERITANPRKRISGTTRLCNKFQSYIDADRTLWWERHRELSRQYALNGEYKKAILNWLKCIIKKPGRIKYNLLYLYFIIQAIKTRALKKS